MDAADVQVYQGPTATAWHHLIAWLMEVTQLNAVEAMAVSGYGAFAAVVGVCGAVVAISQRVKKHPQR